MPISGDITAYVGQVPQYGAGDLLMLWNYLHRKLIVIEAIGLQDGKDPAYGEQKLIHLWVGKIQSLLDTIDFEHGDSWAYIIDRPSGPRIIQRSREHYRIPCDFLWAPRVDLSEIEITSLMYWGRGFGRGLWRGKEVDIQIACNDGALTLIERETRGIKALQGMDLTYELIAHIFHGDLLFGIMTESSRLARPVQVTDRAIVFAAMAKLERAFMLHAFPEYDGSASDQHIVIDEHGRVRLLDLFALEYYTPHQRKKLEEDAEEYHWKRLRVLFEDVLPYSPSEGPMGFMKPASIVLAKTPSPDRLLVIPVRFEGGLRAYLTQNEDDNRRRKKSSKTTRGKSKTLTIGTSPVGPKLGPKANHLVISRTARNVELGAPPPYSEFSPPHRSANVRLVMLAPEPEDVGGASIVELE
ncbi:hypothetical protein MVEN_00313900 [Mycena venus]|uniref:Uncharacterized protein n=1 Tax=Mycena venus TaxID=2733690 RepID=A0A8H6Z2U4_9AGAR|nr:hypothetical protein MVEN_00313900 [Mycena venus]